MSGYKSLDVRYCPFNNRSFAACLLTSGRELSYDIKATYKKSEDNNDCYPNVDCQQLNMKVTPDIYPLLHIRDSTSTLKRTTVLSKLVFNKVYSQIILTVDEIPKTAIMTT